MKKIGDTRRGMGRDSAERGLIAPCLHSTRQRRGSVGHLWGGICTSGTRACLYGSSTCSSPKRRRWASATGCTSDRSWLRPTTGTGSTCPTSSTRSLSESLSRSYELALERSPLLRVAARHEDRRRAIRYELTESSLTSSMRARVSWMCSTANMSALSSARPQARASMSAPSRTHSWTFLSGGLVERSPWRRSTRKAPSRVGEGLREVGCRRFSYESHRILISSLSRERIFRGSVLSRGLS